MLNYCKAFWNYGNEIDIYKLEISSVESDHLVLDILHLKLISSLGWWLLMRKIIRGIKKIIPWWCCISSLNASVKLVKRDENRPLHVLQILYTTYQVGKKRSFLLTVDSRSKQKNAGRLFYCLNKDWASLSIRTSTESLSTSLFLYQHRTFALVVASHSFIFLCYL